MSDLRPDYERLLVVAPNWLGDAVMALPAIQDVRRHFPSARITVAARPAVASLFGMVPAVDAVHTLEWRGRLWAGRALTQDVSRLEQFGANAALLLPNSFASAWLVKRAGVTARIGYATDARRMLLTRGVRVPGESMHQGRYYQHLVRALGIDNGPLDPEVVVPASLSNDARALLTTSGWATGRPLVVMAPGAAYGTAKRWLPAHFARLIVSLASAHDAQCALVGSAADADTTRDVAELAMQQSGGRDRAMVIDLAGRTSLPMLAAVLALGKVCVANDSGAMHLAAAVGTPVTALFGPTRDHETAPLARRGIRAQVLTNPVWCRPCMLRECPIDHRCMRGLDPERVAGSVTDMLKTPGRNDAHLSNDSNASNVPHQ